LISPATEIHEEAAMADKPPDAAPQPGPDPSRDPVQVLVNAIGALPDADRDLVYAWLLRRGFEAEEAGGLTVPPRSRRISVTTLLDPNLELATRSPLAQASGQQMVPVRFSSEQHTQLRQWCSEHGFSMATVIRGLVSRFLEAQLPGQGQPA
jgi:ParG